MKFIGMALGILLALVFFAQVAGFGMLYAVDQTQYAVITRFGEVQRAITSPGLKFKSPVETVVNFDKRLLRIDVPVASMPDRDSQFLEIDAYIRYRITDPKTFLENLRDESTASARIGNLTIAAIRAEVGLRDRKDIIGGDPITLEDGTIIVQPRVNEEGIATRELMMQLVLDRIRADAETGFGVEIRDVRIKRADFPTAAEASVFGRMRSERSVQAQRLRAEGEEQYLTITADVSRKVRVIKADAERDANILQGEGEAEAISILASSLESDPEFFAFRRSLEAYVTFLQDNTTVVFSSDSDLFRYLEGPNLPSEVSDDLDVSEIPEQPETP
jgi:membrane protease subunit HflC